jgi:methylated-DNA-[protein]-cysteine S-methyltransferase
MADSLHDSSHPHTNYLLLSSPIGCLRLVSNGSALLRIEFEGRHGVEGREQDDPVLTQASRELAEYFAGTRRQFSVPLDAAGTAFQKRVWEALRAIPYGELRNYKDIAISLGNPGAVRAVGAANGRNPVPIIVPCHRVIGSNGQLTGFAGGLSVKRALLALEGVDVGDHDPANARATAMG